MKRVCSFSCSCVAMTPSSERTRWGVSRFIKEGEAIPEQRKEREIKFLISILLCLQNNFHSRVMQKNLFPRIAVVPSLTHKAWPLRVFIVRFCMKQRWSAVVLIHLLVCCDFRNSERKFWRCNKPQCRMNDVPWGGELLESKPWKRKHDGLKKS